MIERKQLIDGLFESSNQIRKNMLEEHLDQDGVDITPSQWMILRTVWKNGGLSVKKIAENLKISSSAATQLIDGLVKKDYVTRDAAPNDRRSLIIQISPHAKQKIEEMKEKSYQRLAQLFAVLSDEELQQYAQMNAKIAEGVK
jgi:DNA-binding MarR family transcriptional regulator